MITFTKEQLIAKAEEQIKLTRGLNLTLSAKEHVDMCSVLFEIALASLEAEAVAYADPQAFRNFQAGVARREWMWRNPGEDLIPVYTAPPAPVSLTEEQRAMLRDMDDEIVAELEEEERVCRAAMLQGGKS